MASTADTLTATAAPVTLAAPDSATFAPQGYTYTAAAYVALPGRGEVAVIYWGRNATTHNVDVAVAGYGLGGGVLFQDAFAVESFGEQSVVIGALPGGPIAIGYELVGPGAHFGQATVDYATITPTGSVLSSGYFYPAHVSPGPLSIQPAGPESFKLVWNAHASGFDGGYDRARETQYFGADGRPVNGLQTDADLSIPPVTQAVNTASGTYVLVTDNTLEFHGPGAVQTAGIPNEPAHAITSLAAAALADSRFALAWADSGTDYVSVYDSATNGFGPVIGLDWGGASDLHIAALTDGGFAVSWVKSGSYQGEVFDSAGNGGGIISLAGDVAGIDSHGDLYTVGLDSNGAYVVQTYAVNGGSGGSTRGGRTYTSDNAGDHWTGTAADDTFNLGRGGDVVTGNGGDDTFKFAETPWAGGHITDFNIGDKIDLTGLLAASGYTGSDPVGTGYLKLTTDSQGNGQVWSDYNQPGNSGWWLVTTVDGVGAYDLQLQDGVISHAPGPSPDGTVYTADPNYQAPAGVTKIVLTGSHQTVTGNNTGDTFVSDNTSNHLIGGSGNDTFDLGRDGDIVTGGAGADTYVYQETPWAGGRITDFSVSQGDRIDLNALLAHAGYTSGDPIAEGYIKILDSSNTGAQIWADPDGPGSASGWWLVDTLGPVSAGTISVSGSMITGGGNGAVIVEDAKYTAFRTGVTSIVLAGSSAQQIFGNDLGVTYHDSNNANLIIGGAGNDTFILGSGGSSVSTGAGADTVVISGVPTSHESLTGYTAGTDRVDLRGLLSSIGSTGSDPFNDGHLRFIAVSNSSGDYTELQANDPVHSQWIDVVQIYNTTASQLHYADGWLT